MRIQVEAIYENGVLRPLEPLELAENQHVTITLSDGVKRQQGPQRATEYVEQLRKELEGTGPPPGLEEVRRRLSKIPGNMTEDFIAEREDR